jgi:hypothetical protein
MAVAWHFERSGMPEEKPDRNTRPSRIDEIRQMLEDYANDLRAIIERLRKKLNGRSS